MPPIVACHTNSYGRFGARAAIENVRAAGLEWIELPIRTAGVRTRAADEPLVTTESTPADLAAIDRLLADHGVRVASCACMAGNPLDPANVDLMKRKLDLATHFGVKVVVGDAGSAEDDEQKTRIMRHLREIGDYAGERQITVCCDTHRGLCVNHRQAIACIAELAHPRLRVNFDTANILYYNEHINGEVALARCCHLVKHLHLKDSVGIFGQWNFPALGRGGAVNFLRVYQIMRECGFPGPFSIDIEGVEGEPDLSLADHHARVVESVEYLKSLGYFD